MNSVNSNIFLSLDLELNKKEDKCTNIIQIGGVIFNVQTHEILEKLSLIVNTGEILNPFIIKLTGITQQTHDNGITLQNAYKVLTENCLKHGALIMTTWGCGDHETLKQQLNINYPEWIFGRRYFDSKSLYQSYRLANGLKIQAGLKKACYNMGILFEGPAHNALNDSLNTMKMFIKMLELYKGIRT